MRPRLQDKAECCADGCLATIRRGLLMCKTHWFMVPRDLRQELTDAHDEWQQDRQLRKYLVVRQRCIVAVAELTKREEPTIAALKAELARPEAK